MANIIENLIIYGITSELYSDNDINRFDLIINNKTNNKLNTSSSNNRYFKINLINKIEFITYDQNKKKIKYNIFDYKKK